MSRACLTVAHHPACHPVFQTTCSCLQDLSPLAGEADEDWVPRRRPRAPEQLLALGEVKEKLDYKNIDFLLNFVSASGRIKARRRTRLPPRLQARVTRTIKLARQMALIPYEMRVGDGGEGDTWRRLRAFNKAVL